VPDFASYSTIDPKSMPGVDEQIVYSGWNPEFAGFSYESHSYNTTLGYPPGVSNLGSPELYFNVGLRRSFIGPLMSNVIPMLIVFLLLFVVLHLTSADGTRHERNGFDAAAILEFCAALLFVALLTHNLVRNVIPAGEFAYLEEVVLLGYVAIFLVSLDAALQGSAVARKRLHYQEHAVVKLCYWPLVTGLLLVVTVISLHPW
jgi:hypothetical protein